MLKCLYRDVKMTALETIYKDMHFMTDAGEYLIADGLELREESPFSP